jgi:DGQHR domain-containing protein
MQNKIPALKFEQNERNVLLFSIPAKDLISMSYFNPHEKDRETGIQRPYNKTRSKEIATYIDSDEAVLANNIIINFELEKLGLTLPDVYNEDKHLLDIGRIAKEAHNGARKVKELQGKAAFVIDGQHRLRAFDYTRRKDFPLVVTALVDLSLAEVAEIFVKINYYQKPVNKSLVLDLLGISPSIFPQYYRLHNVVNKLNDDFESPFYGKIRMLGIGKGFISQASIIGAIQQYKVEKVLRNVGVEPTEKVWYDIIWNFFKAVSSVFSNLWGEGRFLSKTVGIRALIKLMGDVIREFDRKGEEFSNSNVQKLLRRIDKKVLVLAEKEGLIGEKGVRIFYDRLKIGLKLT